MNTDGHDELDYAMEHLKGLRRASPPPGLLSRIEDRIAQVDASIISMPQWRMIAAAAVLVLGVNVYALINFSSGNNALSMGDGYAATELVSNYQYYE